MSRARHALGLLAALNRARVAGEQESSERISAQLQAFDLRHGYRRGQGTRYLNNKSEFRKVVGQ